MPLPQGKLANVNRSGGKTPWEEAAQLAQRCVSRGTGKPAASFPRRPSNRVTLGDNDKRICSVGFNRPSRIACRR